VTVLGLDLERLEQLRADWNDCYRPQTPLSFVKGARGWALNLANRRSQVGVVYLLGLGAIGALLR